MPETFQASIPIDHGRSVQKQMPNTLRPCIRSGITPILAPISSPSALTNGGIILAKYAIKKMVLSSYGVIADVLRHKIKPSSTHNVEGICGHALSRARDLILAPDAATDHHAPVETLRATSLSPNTSPPTKKTNNWPPFPLLPVRHPPSRAPTNRPLRAMLIAWGMNLPGRRGSATTSSATKRNAFALAVIS